MTASIKMTDVQGVPQRPQQTRKSRSKSREWTEWESLREEPEENQTPLRFTPTAWAKLLFLRDEGQTEIGGFGITPPDDLLLVEDIRLVEQICSSASVQFDDASVADLFDEMVDEKRQPEQFARIWIHTHPRMPATPSFVDEETFEKVFGRCDWSVMFILSKTEDVYARLQINKGLSVRMPLPVVIDWTRPFEASDEMAWSDEYYDNVRCWEPPAKTANTAKPVIGIPATEQRRHDLTPADVMSEEDQAWLAMELEARG